MQDNLVTDSLIADEKFYFLPLTYYLMPFGYLLSDALWVLITNLAVFPNLQERSSLALTLAYLVRSDADSIHF